MIDEFKMSPTLVFFSRRVQDMEAALEEAKKETKAVYTECCPIKVGDVYETQHGEKYLVSLIEFTPVLKKSATFWAYGYGRKQRKDGSFTQRITSIGYLLNKEANNA